MNSMYRLGLLPLSMLMLVAPAVWAHKPIFPDGHGCDQANAIAVEDVTVSQVAYTAITQDCSQLWLTFDAVANQDLYLQLALPQIDRFKDLRPSVALLGPGLPALAGVPFAVPAGYGGYVFATSEVATPTAFHEPFTGTDDWILKELNQTLPNDGKYYLVAYLPPGLFGKIWVAFGTKEQFGPEDFLHFGSIVRQTRAFHEVSGPGGICPLAGFGTLALAMGTVAWVRYAPCRRR